MTPDLTYRVESFFVSFIPHTAAGESAWRELDAQQGGEGGKVLFLFKDQAIKALRRAGYIVRKAPAMKQGPAMKAETEALYAELTA